MFTERSLFKTLKIYILIVLFLYKHTKMYKKTVKTSLLSVVPENTLNGKYPPTQVVQWL